MFKKRTSAALLSSAFLLTHCADQTQATSEFKIDSAHALGVDAIITDGVILTSTTSNASIDKQIRAQMQYLTGQLNGINGGADLNRLEISINEKNPRENGTFEVHYAAKVLIAWRRDLALPESYELILPSGGDNRSLGNFFNAFQDSCASSSAHDMSSGSFWYYYRPKSQDCQAVMTEEAQAALVSRFPIYLKTSTENTSGKSPEYSKIWEDQRIVVTAVFGKYEDGATESGDAGIAAYNEMYKMLHETFGTPDMQDVELAEGVRPGSENPAVHMVFGNLDVDILLVDGIQSADAAFKQRYNARTKISDLVSYNGHSGLGANIRALARLGSFQQNQYQLFFVNGCDTFAYVDNALRDAHQVANPGSGPNKYFDIITNAMPSYFRSNAENNLALIQAFRGQSLNYRQILAKFDKAQRAVVTGEDDNAWPAAF